MPSHPRFLVLFAVLGGMLTARTPASALSEALGKTEIACQSALAQALGKYGKARAGCVVSCQKKTPLSAECVAPFGGKTLECVQKADGKLAGLVAKKCQSNGTDEDSCPECWEAVNGTCTGFGNAATTKAIALTDSINTAVFCDDSGSPDGLSKAEAKCQKALVSGFANLVSGANGCITKCLKGERKAKTDGTCNPEAFLLLGGDSKTVNCVFKAFGKILKASIKCEAPTGDSPECAPDVFTLFTSVQHDLADIGGDVDVCPAQCGDGFTQGLEECDPPGAPVCAGNSQCSAQCTCTS